MGLALAAPALGCRSETAQATKPNVMLIMTDDQPYHTIGVMKSLRNRVAAAGMRFDNGYVATPVYGPARGSVLTGKWSHNTGLEGTNGAWQDLVDSDELPRNVAKRLQAVGYTCHLSGKFTNDLNSGEWVCPGFDSWWAQLEPVNDEEHLYFSEGERAAARCRGPAPRGATRPWWRRGTRRISSAGIGTSRGSPASGRTPRMAPTTLSTSTPAHTRARRPRPRSASPAGTCQTRPPSSANSPTSPKGARPIRGRITGAISARSRRSTTPWTG